MEDKIKYVLDGIIKYYTREELRTYYKGVCIASKAYRDETFDSYFEELIITLNKYDGDPYGYLPSKTRIAVHKYEALTGSFLVFYSDNPTGKEAPTSSDGNEFKTRLQLHTDECKAVSNPKDIKIDPNIKKIL